MTTEIARTTLALARALLARPSVSPDDGGCVDLLEGRLRDAGFTCERFDRAGVRNLWARQGTTGPVVCLCGHVDVVAPGPLDRWTSDPFTPTERDGFLYARGASDMKGPLAAMVTALERIAQAGHRPTGSIALLVTSDEEGQATDGTVAVVESLRARGELIDFGLVGEPTAVTVLGDTIKNGRRGSLNGTVRIHGVQGHIAYPHLGQNALHLALPVLAELAAETWDRGNAYFEPTSLQFSNLRAGTGATNVMPGLVEASFNVRFSPETTAAAIRARVEATLRRHGVDADIEWHLSGEPFLTPAGRLVDAVTAAIRAETGGEAALSTGGGTSDGRFLATIAREVVEVGPPNDTIHKIDERIRLDDLAPLSRIYERVVRDLIGLPAA